MLGPIFSGHSSNQRTTFLLPISHKKYPLSLTQTRLPIMLLMHPVLFCYHFPHSQAPFPLSVTDGRQSQFQQSVLTCPHLSCPSPLSNESSSSQPLQHATVIVRAFLSFLLSGCTEHLNVPFHIYLG